MGANGSGPVAVLGAGLWGAVLAQHVAEKGTPVRLWEFFPELARRLDQTRLHPHLPGIRLMSEIAVTSDMRAAVDGARTVLIVVPSPHVRNTGKHLRPLLEALRTPPILVSASKGIEPGTLKTMTEILEEEIPSLKGKVFAFSGPSFAREVARGVPTKLLLAGPAGAALRSAQRVLDGNPLCVELYPDRKGVELGGSLKNVLAIGCGILDGLKSGANTKAALITQGIAEMGLLIQKHGGRYETIYTLAGIGDLIATGTSIESRNRAFGEKVGSGRDVKTAVREIPTVVEGVESSKSAHELCRSVRLKAPLVESIWGIVHEQRDPRTILKALGFN